MCLWIKNSRNFTTGKEQSSLSLAISANENWLFSMYFQIGSYTTSASCVCRSGRHLWVPPDRYWCGWTNCKGRCHHLRTLRSVGLSTYLHNKSVWLFLENICKDWNKLCVVKYCTAIALPQVENINTHFPGYLLSKKRGRFSDTFCITVGIHAVTTLSPVFTRD